MAQTVACTTTEKDILSGENGEIFKAEKEKYQANLDEISKGNYKGVSIKVVLGNWCEDSQREVPRLMQILNTKYTSKIPVEYFLVDHDKNCADPEVQKLEVKYVPAIIFYRNGKELGRIVEAPKKSLEGDMVKIVGE